MKTYTVLYKAQVQGRRFLSSTLMFATSKKDAAERTLKEFAHATEITSVLQGR